MSLDNVIWLILFGLNFGRTIYVQFVRQEIFCPPSYGGCYKITVVSVRLSVRLSVCQFGIFLRNGSLVFPNFLHDARYLEYLKTDRALFPIQNRVFWIFLNILWLVFPRNNLKWRLMLFCCWPVKLQDS